MNKKFSFGCFFIHLIPSMSLEEKQSLLAHSSALCPYGSQQLNLWHTQKKQQDPSCVRPLELPWIPFVLLPKPPVSLSELQGYFWICPSDLGTTPCPAIRLEAQRRKEPQTKITHRYTAPNVLCATHWNGSFSSPKQSKINHETFHNDVFGGKEHWL